jgi:hypothetical protein
MSQQAAMDASGNTKLDSQGLGMGGHQKSEILPDNALATPIVTDPRTPIMTNCHTANIHKPESYGNNVIDRKEVAPGVQSLHGSINGNAVADLVGYSFDPATFTTAQAMDWMKTNASDRDFTFTPAKEETKRSCQDNWAELNPNEIRLRSIDVSPETWDEDKGRVWGVLATDAPVFSTDLRTGKPVHEVWRIDGIEPDAHVPLLDNHKRDSVRNILGSIRETSPRGEHEYGGWIYISEAEPTIRTKVRERHVRELSAGMQPRATTVIPAGKTATVRCRTGDATYTARADQPLFVHTALLLREVSLPVKGADSNTQIRSENISSNTRNISMKESLRKQCERLGMPTAHDATQATEWYSKLPAETQRSVADMAEKDEKDTADKAKAKKDAEDEEVRKRSAAPTTESIRAEIDAAITAKQVEETARREAIQKIAKDIPADVVRKAIDDGMTVEQAGMAFLDAVRNRTAPAGPAIHSHSREKDLTADVLGTALVLRSLNQVSSNTPGSSYRSDPVEIIGRYGPNEFNTTGFGDWVGRNPTDPLNEDQKQRNYQLLNQADRFRHLSMADIMAECVRLDGKSISGYPSRNEVIRAGLGGGSFGAIFTTNFNALFLAGYLEAEDTTYGWVTEGEAPNFMTGELAMIGKMGNLTLAGKSKADQLTYGDWNESITVRRLSGAYEVDETDLINDRFGAIQTNSPQEMGLVARRVRPNAIYSMLLGNYSAGVSRGPTLNQDGQPLFCAAHGNFLAAANNDIYDPATGAVGVKGLQAAVPAIRKQRLGGVPLNLKPRFVLAGPDLDMALRIAFFSTQRIVASGSGGTANPLEQLNISMRSDARMDDIGSVDPFNNNAAVAGKKYHYILACRPGEEGAKTVHVNYLQGSGRAPQIRSYMLGGPGAPGRWGIGWDIKLDIGLAPADYRGLYYAEATT